MTIRSLKQQLLDELNDQEFCQAFLIAITDGCSSWLRSYFDNGRSESDLLYVYLLREIAQNIQSWMEVTEPIEATEHDRITTALLSPLTNAIVELDNSQPTEKNAAMNALIEAFTLL